MLTAISWLLAECRLLLLRTAAVPMLLLLSTTGCWGYLADDGKTAGRATNKTLLTDAPRQGAYGCRQGCLINAAKAALDDAAEAETGAIALEAAADEDQADAETWLRIER